MDHQRSLASYEDLDHDGALNEVLCGCVKLMLEKPTNDPTKPTYQIVVTKINSYNKTTTKIEISVESLRTFVSRPRTKLTSKNQTAKAVHSFLIGNFHKLDDQTKTYLLEGDNWQTVRGKNEEKQRNNEELISTSVRLLGSMMYTWFNFANSDLVRVFSKIAGKYVMLRKSVRDKHQIIKSELDISLDENKKIIRAIHIHADRQGVRRRSEGIVVGVVRNLHILLQVEDGEGAELISLREPVQRQYKKMMGFMQSINMDRKILSARVFVEREDDFWRSIKPRFTLDELDDHPQRKIVVASLLDEGTCLTIPDIQLDDEGG